MRVTTIARLAPRPPAAVEPVAGATVAAVRERRDAGRHGHQGHQGHQGHAGHREPIVVHVPMPRGPSGGSCAVRDAYRLESDRPAVDLYL